MKSEPETTYHEPHQGGTRMKMNLFLAATVFILLSTAPLVGAAEATKAEPVQKQAVTNNHQHLFMKMSRAEHEKLFPKGHKKIAGKECIFDREIDAYFCQYWDKYDGYAPK